jgi:hypothetical protein
MVPEEVGLDVDRRIVESDRAPGERLLVRVQDDPRGVAGQEKG